MVKKGKSAATKKPCDSLAKVQKLLDDEIKVNGLINQEMERMFLHANIVDIEKHKWDCSVEDAEMRLTSIGYIFSPEDVILVLQYLRNKYLDYQRVPLNPIKEAVVYGTHPLNLIENYPAAGAGNVWYFFTRSRPNETQPPEGGHWIFGEEMDILYKAKKVGVKQLVQYCEGGRKTEYKIDDYRLESPPDNLNGPWFICKLYKDESCEDVQS